MASVSAISSAIKTAIEAVDLSAYAQDTAETHMREALTLDPDGPGYVTPHLVYFLSPVSTDYLDRGRGVTLATSNFTLSCVFRLRPNLQDQWADVDSATDASELLRSAITNDLGGATCKVTRITFVGASPDGATFGVNLDILAVHHSNA